MFNSLVQTCLKWQMGTTSVKERVMGFVEVNVNGQWMNLMHMTLRCQLCNEEVILAHVAKIENADAPVNATWTCKKCHSING
jgi:uncharacterized protein with PIN domain